MCSSFLEYKKTFALLVAILTIVLAPLLTSACRAQAVSGRPDELATSSECRMLIHLGNYGVITIHGAHEFSRSGDVWLYCPGRSIPLTQTGDVFSFALFPDGRRMAVVRHPDRIPDSDAPALLVVIDLSTGKVLQKEQLTAQLYGHQVISTCGTVLLLGYRAEETRRGGKVASHVETEAKDLVAGKRLENPNFNSIRCTADRSVVLRKIGVPWAAGGIFYIGETNDNVLVRDGAGDFAVSTNGRYVAFTAADRVCLAEPTSANSVPICSEGFWGRGRLDVSDNGEVWLTGDSMESCPGKVYADMHTFTCDAIFKWDSSQSAPALVAYGYVDPSGISSTLGQQILAFAKNWKR